MRLKKYLIGIVGAALLLAGGAQAAFYQWSKTAASNATADPSINWSEGMSPSSVNDSARAMMARAAEYRDDISGLLATGGTSTAYTVTTNQGLPSTPTDGQLLSFTMHATNGVAPTLAADSGTAYPIQTAAGTAVSAAVLISGSPYSVKFSSSASAWILRNFYGNPFTVPIGALVPYFGSTVPNSNFIFPAGQCISRTTYAAFFAMVSTTFGACDGVTTFAAPDMRGRTVVAIDNLGGSAANRLTSTYFGATTTAIGNAGGAESTTFAKANLPNVNFTVTDPGHTHGNSLGASQIYVANDFEAALTVSGGTRGSRATLSSATTGITVSSGGSGTPISRVMPAMTMTYILRVL